VQKDHADIFEVGAQRSARRVASKERL
jgi:hypothetical protein